MASLTSELPDPKSFQTWEDAFKYPIPVVRRMEQQLRIDISSNRERLRTLVGTSYRELLGTADTIVHMDKQIKHAEEYLSIISHKCNTRLLEESKANALRISRNLDQGKARYYAHTSHLALLQRCPNVLIRLLKPGGSLQLAAQVLILSRLLHKKASEDMTAETFVDSLRTRLGKLRSRLLIIVDRRLADPACETDTIIDAMCAYSLATNSSSADVLRHFHSVRFAAISTDIESLRPGEAEILRGIKLWISTTQITQELFPRKVSDALARLKNRPLLQLEAIEGIHELDLDMHSSFIDDDIKHFTPYIRHDDLNVALAAQQLSAWSKPALMACVENLTVMLQKISDFQAILDLRRQFLHLWIASKGRLIGTNKSEGVDIFRDVFQARLLQRIAEQVTNIGFTISIIERTVINETNPTVPSHDLWSSKIIHADLGDGAKKLLEGIHHQVHGSDGRHDEIIDVYQKWVSDSNMIRMSILDLKVRKWTIEELDEEEEGIEEIEDIKYRLEKEDPAQLDEKYETAVSAAIQTLQEAIEQQYRKLSNNPHSSTKAIFMLRLLREIKKVSPDGFDPRSMVFPSVVNLQTLVARSIIDRLLPKCEKAFSLATQEVKLPVRLLWDGTPELPVVSSPWSFRLLKALHRIMSTTGQDIWTRSAANQLKTMLKTDMGIMLLKARHSTNQGNGNGGEDASQDIRDANIQLLFDVSYLQAALALQSQDHTEDLDDFCKTLINFNKLEMDESDRIKKTATDYWRKTSLLFGLLA